MHRPCQLVIGSTEVDLGILPKEGEATARFWVENQGDDSVRLNLGVPTCRCTQATIEKSLLRPGEATSIRMAMRSRPDAAGPSDAQVYLTAEGQMGRNPRIHGIQWGARFPEYRYLVGGPTPSHRATITGSLYLRNAATTCRIDPSLAKTGMEQRSKFGFANRRTECFPRVRRAEMLVQRRIACRHRALHGPETSLTSDFRWSGQHRDDPRGLSVSITCALRLTVLNLKDIDADFSRSTLILVGIILVVSIVACGMDLWRVRFAPEPSVSTSAGSSVVAAERESLHVLVPVTLETEVTRAIEKYRAVPLKLASDYFHRWRFDLRSGPYLVNRHFNWKWTTLC